MSARAEGTTRARVLFVDDEERVLNSMRIMFRRQFDLFLATNGTDALKIVRDHEIDVIVADHRMPKITGVEVLSQVRIISPRTVRILLTGYADLDAVEGSINQGEVFRFLTKPCAPPQLRATLDLAVRVARESAALESRDHTATDTVEVIMNRDPSDDTSLTQTNPQIPQHLISGPATRIAPAHASDATGSGKALPSSAKSEPQPATSRPRPRSRLPTGLGVVVFSVDSEVVETVQQAVRGRIPVYRAGNVVQVVKILQEHKPGVLVTDVSEDKATIHSMTASLKEHLPELVTIAVSQHRDVLDMVWLINHGQIFRFLRKPLSPGRCAISLQAALQHHRLLLRNPDLVKRHEVIASGEAGLVDTLLAKLRNVKRLWAST